MNDEEGLLPGTDGFGSPEEMNVLPEDLHIHKKYENSFNKTSLGNKLLEYGVDTVVVTGFCAEHCVLSTYRGAEDLDLTAIVLRGAIASGNPKYLRFVEAISEVISHGTLVKVLGS